MTFDPTIVTVVCSALTGVVAVLCTKGVDAYIKWRKTNHEIEADICHSDDERADIWAKLVIERQQKDIEGLKADVQLLVGKIETLQRDHMNCEKQQAELRTEIAFLKRQLGQA